jgi:hypothetical protein
MLSTIWFSLLVAIGLYGVSSYIRPLEGSKRNPQKLLAGILSLAYAALHLHATYALIFAPLPYADIFFRAAGWIVCGMLITMIAFLVSAQSVNTMLMISAVLFVGLPLALLPLHWAAHGVSLDRIFASPFIYGGEAFPVGLAIPAVVLLLRERRRGGDTQASSERTTEEGTGA